MTGDDGCEATRYFRVPKVYAYAGQVRLDCSRDDM